MSRPRFLADHDLNDRIIEGLRRREPASQVVRLREVLAVSTPDPRVLEYAASAGLIVVSHDASTMTAVARQRIAAGEAMVGLIIAPQSLGVRRAVDGLELVWGATEAEEWHARVVFLPF